MLKRRISALLLAALLFLTGTGALAAETQTEPSAPPIEIYTVQDLADIEKHPDGSYILMADLDMSGISWKPLEFSGTLDGNGHAILNLTIFQPGENMVKITDADENTHDAASFGLFSALRGATVQNLTMINTRARVEWPDRGHNHHRLPVYRHTGAAQRRLDVLPGRYCRLRQRRCPKVQR